MRGSALETLLATCPSPEAGCLASDTEAAMTLMADDDVTNVNAHNILDAVLEAASEEVSLEDATYFNILPEGEGPGPSSTIVLSSDEQRVRVGFGLTEFGMTDAVYEQPVINDSNSPLQNRLATCAYVCAMRSESCPILIEVE